MQAQGALSMVPPILLHLDHNSVVATFLVAVCVSVYIPASTPVHGDSPVPGHFGAAHGVHCGPAELGLQGQQLLCQHLSVKPILHCGVLFSHSLCWHTVRQRRIIAGFCFHTHCAGTLPDKGESTAQFALLGRVFMSILLTEHFDKGRQESRKAQSAAVRL